MGWGVTRGCWPGFGHGLSLVFCQAAFCAHGGDCHCCAVLPPMCIQPGGVDRAFRHSSLHLPIATARVWLSPNIYKLIRRWLAALPQFIGVQLYLSRLGAVIFGDGAALVGMAFFSMRCRYFSPNRTPSRVNYFYLKLIFDD